MEDKCGFDTSIVVRLITGLPADDFTYCVRRLTELQDNDTVAVASNQVIGEAYIAVQHHYRLSESEARAGLLRAFLTGLVSPLNGSEIITMLQAPINPGLFDRLIANGYQREELETLTLDRRMSRLPGVRRI